MDINNIGAQTSAKVSLPRVILTLIMTRFILIYHAAQLGTLERLLLSGHLRVKMVNTQNGDISNQK
jgi:hypothetical protein